jgi:hypothetical protein
MCSCQPTLGLIVSKIKQNIYSAQPFFSGLTTAQAVDILLLYGDFPGL